MPFIPYTVNLTTDSSGDATEYSERVEGGFIYAVVFYSNWGETIDISAITEHGRLPVLAITGLPSSSTDRRYYPLATGHDSVGAEAEWATGIPLKTPIPIADERIEITIANGGNTRAYEVTVSVIETQFPVEVAEEEE